MGTIQEPFVRFGISVIINYHMPGLHAHHNNIASPFSCPNKIVIGVKPLTLSVSVPPFGDKSILQTVL